MLSNYFKIAFKVLKRRKFFTIISLFGISFTITILMVAAAIVDHQLNPVGTEIKSDRMVSLHSLIATDSTNSIAWSSHPGYSYANKYVKTLKTPEMVTVYSHRNKYVTYLNGKKLKFSYKFTDSEYWKVFDFVFIEGKPYSKPEEERGAKLAVISEKTALDYFGSTKVAGKTIEVDGSNYTVSGVVENVSALNSATNSDIWIPATSSSAVAQSKFFGSFNATALLFDRNDELAVQKEYHKHMFEAIPDLPQKSKLSIIKSKLETREDFLARKFFGTDFDNDYFSTKSAEYIDSPGISKTTLMFGSIVGLMVLFMVLPSINLININLSRIIERSSEIGVRKAFGASRWVLVGQFITENLILTFIGGMLGLFLTGFAIELINSSGFIEKANISINYRIFIISIIISGFFGLMSGAWPALKMARLHPVEAIRGGVQ